VLWIVWGGIGYRRREVATLRTRLEKERKGNSLDMGQEITSVQATVGEMGELAEPAHSDGVLGTTFQREGQLPDEDEPVGIKQYRTLMVLNIPPDSK
jgi:hypothetical protein